ncbi:hypothetical protein K439DRAFT_1396231 [Ramaria rubella]|nr:hypothetical protein K439DRAFT_1396231 [Ramaria rubella]
MVLKHNQPITPIIFTNKENIIFKPSTVVLCNTNGRRPRSHSLSTPPVLVAREASRDPAHRRAQSSTVRTPTRTLRTAAEDLEVEIAEVIAPDGSQRSVKLPRHLKRPTFRDISPAALEAVDPDLKGVAMEYILQSLQAVGPRMLTVAATTTANPPRDRLPRELEVVINDLSAEAPTHLFAIYSTPTSQVALHPAHALVLAAHCSHLPTLLHSKPTQPTSAGSTLTLPVVPLCLPHPATFPILLFYLYTKRREHLFASLLPMVSRDANESIEQLARTLAATFTVQALLSHAARIHGFWRNVATLGIFDDKLWQVMEMAWELLGRALAIGTVATWHA